MSEVKVLNKVDKYAHASAGSLHGFEGNQFAKDATGATSCEISFGTLPTGAAVPFFHSHKESEENYPTDICGFRYGTAEVEWQLNPDGRHLLMFPFIVVRIIIIAMENVALKCAICRRFFVIL